MYRIEIRLYQTENLVQAYGEYSEDWGQGTQALCTGKWLAPLEADTGVLDHPQIISAARAVCLELARNLDVPLF